MSERTCIVTRVAGDPDDLIRFVAGPDMAVVPDLARKLPGRGCWVTAGRAEVEQAVRRKLFARALKAPVEASPELPGLVDVLLVRSALGALGLARKAGGVALGATKADAAIRSGKAVLVLHAHEAAVDGVRKIDQARRATAAIGGPQVPAFRLFGEAEMSLALGATNVIHAAVLAGGTGSSVLRRMVALHRYRGGTPEVRLENAAEGGTVRSAEDME
jgi:uncharacterized protein